MALKKLGSYKELQDFYEEKPLSLKIELISKTKLRNGKF